MPLVLNAKGIETVLHSRNGPVVRDLIKKAVKVTSGAKRRCPVDTGRLRASIRWSLIRGAGVGYWALVGTDVEYAAAVHEGTKAHTVSATRGGTTYTLSVPDRRPRPFLRDALKAAAL